MAKSKNPPGKKPSKAPVDDDTTDETEESEDTEDEDTEEDAEAQNRRINAIVTSRVKREMKGVLSTLAQMQESLKTLAAAPKKTEESDDDSEETDDSQETGKKVVIDPKLSKKMNKLEMQLAEEKAARKKAETERAEEQEKARSTEMRTIFGSALAEHGVSDPVLQRAALREIEASGCMVRDEDGKIKFKGVDKYGIDTLYDPKVGLKGWIATDGKSFVPAVDAGGSGTGGARGTGNGTEALSAKQFSKLSEQQKASINLERACSGQPPLGE